MALDMAKYRRLFLEEAGEHLAEMGSALLALEKEPGSSESIDLAFRMAHSIKSMAASLAYDAISDVAHSLEDRLDTVRAGGTLPPGELSLLFSGLEGLEAMVGVVRENGEAPPPRPELVAALGAPRPEPAAAASETPSEARLKKKLLS